MAAGKLKGITWGYIPDKLLFSSASSNAKVMYTALTRYLNTEGQAWPSQETLARRLSWSESTVRRAITELLRLGWLTKEQNRVNHGTWAANIYTLNLKLKRQRTKLRRHRRSNLTAGADQGKQPKAAGHNRRSNLTDKREKTSYAQDATRLVGAPRPRAELPPDQRRYWSDLATKHQADELFLARYGYYPTTEGQEYKAAQLLLDEPEVRVLPFR